MTTREELFWSKVTPEPMSGCWLWTAGVSGSGYGRFSRSHGKRGMDTASRVAWTLRVGPIPPGMLICHRCDNPPCVNPDHLFLGTARDNIRDAARKGRLWMQNDPAKVRLVAARSAATRAASFTPSPPRPCMVCDVPYKPLRRGRCHSCNEYWRRHGAERPPRLYGSNAWPMKGV